MAIINEKGINAHGYYVSTKGVTTDGRLVVFRTISERDRCKPIPAFAWVIDATDDPTVDTGSAFYAYTNKGWLKLYETEAMDQIPGGGPAGPINWEQIIGKPNSEPTDIDVAVQQTHQHENISVLGQLGDDNGSLTYNGQKIGGSDVIDQHTTLIAELTNLLNALTVRVNASEVNIENNASEIVSVRTDLEALINQLSLDLSNLETTVSAHGDQITNIEGDVSANTGRISTLDELLTALTSRVTVAESNIQSNTSAIETNTQTIADNKTAIEADQERQNNIIRGLNDSVNTLSGTVSDHESTIQANQADIRANTTRIEALENATPQEPVDLTDLENRMTAVENELGLVQDKVSTLEDLVGV